MVARRLLGHVGDHRDDFCQSLSDRRSRWQIAANRSFDFLSGVFLFESSGGRATCDLFALGAFQHYPPQVDDCICSVPVLDVDCCANFDKRLVSISTSLGLEIFKCTSDFGRFDLFHPRRIYPVPDCS